MSNVENGNSDDAKKADSKTNSPDTGTFTPATPAQKSKLAVLLILTTIILVAIWLLVICCMEEKLHQETRVPWADASTVEISTGPPNFYIDRAKKELVFVGPMDKEAKGQLVELIEKDGVGKETVRLFKDTIDQLAYRANTAQCELLLYLLLVGGVSGTVGVLLRSLINFVGNTSHREQLDVARWWPWYVIRPFTGFIIGVLLIALFQTGLLSSKESAPGGTLWWVAVAALGGFGADDFTERLRLLSKTLFGQSK